MYVWPTAGQILGGTIDTVRIHTKVQAISEAHSSGEKRPSQRLIEEL